ncbi:MAG: c-type cytochrome [SAR324 cluster bacterium]|nr:c-type cytochrome [SAR324 cluster bacterium]
MKLTKKFWVSLLGCVLVLLPVMISCSETKTTPQPATDKYKVPDAPAEYLSMTNPYTSQEDVTKGGELYQGKCSDCHGEIGEGDEDGDDVAFNDTEWMKTRTDGQLFYIARNGAGPDMEMEAYGPGSDADMSEKKIWQIVSYIRTLAK